MSGTSWTDANQKVLVAEFARIRARIAGEETAATEAAAAAARAAIPSRAAIDVIVESFGLSAFERDILLMCAGMEMDAALAASAHPGATFGVALSKLEEPHWSALAPSRPLRLWKLIEVGDLQALTTSRLNVDERVLHYLGGINYLDICLRPLLRKADGGAVLTDLQTESVDHLADALAVRDARPLLLLHGDDRAAHLEVASRVTEGLGLQLYVVRASDLPSDPHDADEIALRWTRESVLLGAALLVESRDADAVSLQRFVARVGGVTFVSASIPLELSRESVDVRIDRPLVTEQRRLWERTLGERATDLNGSLDFIAGQFRVTTDVMRKAVNSIPASRLPQDAMTHIASVCRDSTRKRLEDLAPRIEPRATWADLVLPEPQISTLRQVAAHVRRRSKVFFDWGFDAKCARGQGVSVLFTGESGTGKTMAAEVLANELELDLYRIDLAGIVSKYIGETEKNLRRVFDAAEDSGAILLFDEADALFGKRSDVKDSHDRYANIEVSYLLQRMEAYRGLAILTTNMKGAIDVAFQRRLRFVVPFPFPDQLLREQIWRRAFPADTPLDTIDPRRLAQLNVPGGNIRNIALGAAFIAADLEQPVGMPHLLNAARAEAAKRERPFSEAEVRGWV